MPSAKKKAKSKPVLTVVPRTTMEEVIAQLEDVRAALAGDLPPVQRAKMVTELRSYLKLKADLEQKEALLEDKVANHPKVVEMRDKILGAISACPKCATAVLEVLGGG